MSMAKELSGTSCISGMSDELRAQLKDMEMGRDAIEQLLTQARVAETRLEGRILPVQRSRAAGIAGL